jgi:phage terminase large subunit-like protein
VTKAKAKPARARGAGVTSRDPVTAYARSVVTGKRIAGPHVRAACERHLRDLATGHERGLWFDVAAATRAINFFPDVLRLNGGEFEGQPFELIDWQKFIVGSLFGWKGADGWRRFRVAYIETAKGSGKSPLAAGIGMYGLVADSEPRAEIYAAATKKDQAMVLFRDAVAMWQQSPVLSAALLPSGVGERVWNLAYPSAGSFFRPIAADDGQSGPRPHISLVDEVHEHKTNAVVELLRAGTKSRRQAIILMITNSGSSRTSPCWGYHEYAAKVCAGQLEDDSFFGYVCALDEGEDPFRDEACWPKVNPSLQAANLPGVKYLREQVTEARGMPSKEAMVRRLNFCQWTDAENPWISGDLWFKAKLDFDWRSLRGRRATAGLDLSSTTDLTALVFYVEPERPESWAPWDEWSGRRQQWAEAQQQHGAGDDFEPEPFPEPEPPKGEPWLIVPFAWVPGDELDRKEDLDRVPYLAWVRAGHLFTSPGRGISKLMVLRKLVEMADFFELTAVAYDRWRIEDLLALAKDNELELPELTPFGQGFKDMSPALEAFELDLLNGRVAHSGHPVLTWCAANAVTESDPAENRKLSKARATGRIDLMVATVMARAMLKSSGPAEKSFWES